MTSSLSIQPNHLTIVKSILRKYLPQQSQVWIFGSRTTGKIKRFSDLDIAIDAGSPLSINIIAALKADFDDSDLPYKVDVIDWVTVSESFRNKISDKIKLDFLST